MKKYAIHPDYIKSQKDGQRHYITYLQLITLYKLNPKDCILWDYSNENTYRGRNSDDYIHLGVRYDGNYIID